MDQCHTPQRKQKYSTWSTFETRPWYKTLKYVYLLLNIDMLVAGLYSQCGTQYKIAMVMISIDYDENKLSACVSDGKYGMK